MRDVVSETPDLPDVAKSVLGEFGRWSDDQQRGFVRTLMLRLKHKVSLMRTSIRTHSQRCGRIYHNISPQKHPCVLLITTQPSPWANVSARFLFAADCCPQELSAGMHHVVLLRVRVRSEKIRAAKEAALQARNYVQRVDGGQQTLAPDGVHDQHAWLQNTSR